MKAFLVRVLVNALAIWVATLAVPGLSVHSNGNAVANQFLTYVAIALIFGFLNAVLKPVVKLLSLPLYVLTLGLFTFIVNALMLQVTSWLAGKLTLTFHVHQFFWDAVLGAIVISLVSMVVSLILPDSWEGKEERV